MKRVWLAAGLCTVLACDGSVAPGGTSGGESGTGSSGSGGAVAGGSGGAGSGSGAGTGGAGSGGSAAGGSAAGSGGTAGSAGSAGSSGAGGSAGGAGTRAGSGGSAGSAGSAGSSGSGGSGGSTAPGASCTEGTYLLCEDFEGTAAGGIPMGWTKHGDPVAVAEDEAASGKRSLKLGERANGERRIYHDAMSLPSTHYGRVRFKVKLPVPDAFVHSTIVTLYGKTPKADMLNLEVRVVDTVKESKQGFNNDGNGSHYQVLYNVQPEGRGEFAHGSSYDWKFDDQWHCAEWFIDSKQQAFKFWYDGKEIDDVEFDNGPGNYDNSEIPSAFREIRLGWNNYQSAPPGFTAWVDDFAMATTKIGCD